MKTNQLVVPAEDLVMGDRELLAHPRPTVDREQLQHHLREALRLLHVDMENEKIRDTPRRWADSLVAMTSGYDYTGVKKLTTLFRKACSKADESCQNLVVVGGTYKTLCAHHASGRPCASVDFSRSIVLGVFLGTRPTAGFTVEITSVERDGEGLTVFYRERKPGPDDMVAQMLTAPFVLVTTDRVSGPIRFRPSAS